MLGKKMGETTIPKPTGKDPVLLIIRILLFIIIESTGCQALCLALGRQ